MKTIHTILLSNFSVWYSILIMTDTLALTNNKIQKSRLHSILFYLKLLATAVALCALYFGLMCGLSLLPRADLDNNAHEATEIFISEENPPEWHYGIYYFQNPFARNDTHTDSLMVANAYMLNADHPVRSAMEGIRIEPPEDGLVADTFLDYLNTGEFSEQTAPYSRYWHGYLLTLRPALSVMGLPAIRATLFLVAMALFMLLFSLMLKRLGGLFAGTFAAAMVLSGFPIFLQCMQYAPAFFIGMGAMLVLLLRPDMTERSVMLVFLFVGSTMAFFDLFTTPMVTLCLPLLTYLLMRYKAPSVSRISEKQLFINMLRICLVWGITYLVTWSSKWFFAALTVDPAIFSDAGGEMMMWLQATLPVGRLVELPSGFLTRLGAIAIQFVMYLPFSLEWNLTAYVVVVVVLLAAYIVWIIVLAHRVGRSFTLWLPLAFVFAIPLLWTFIVANHSLHHFPLFYRVVLTSVWILLFLPGLLGTAVRDNKKPIKRLAIKNS